MIIYAIFVTVLEFVAIMDKENQIAKEPLMFKDKIENEDSDSESLWSSDVRRSRQRRMLFSRVIQFLPWALLVLLGSWDLIRHRSHPAEEKCYPAQQIYS